MLNAVPTILLIGPTGQLGAELANELPAIGNVVAGGRAAQPPVRYLDLTMTESLRDCMREVAPDIVINAAAYTAVDKAEDEPQLADKINAQALRVIAAESRDCNALLVHFSTDYVFNGAAHTPYKETDQPDPISIYGVTKLAGDKLIAESGVKHLIIRTSWVYSASGHNFVRTIHACAMRGQCLEVVDDQVGAPTSARSLARFTTQILVKGLARGGDWLRENSGVYHACAGGQCSWYELAQRIVEHCGNPRTRLKPLSTQAYPSRARRPLFSVLDCRRAEEVFGLRMRSWQSGVDEVLHQLQHTYEEEPT